MLVLAVVAATAGGCNRRQHYYYLNPSEIDLTVLLPPPPDVASAQARSDEAQVAAAVAGRSSSAVSSKPKSESARTVFFYAPSVGARIHAGAASDHRGLLFARRVRRKEAGRRSEGVLGAAAPRRRARNGEARIRAVTRHLRRRARSCSRSCFRPNAMRSSRKPEPSRRIESSSDCTIPATLRRGGPPGRLPPT